MGLYDTIVFPKPIACSGCGAALASTQTKVLGNTLDTYRVGDVVDSCPVVTGVLEERLYCNDCKGMDQKVYFTIWHSLLTGVYGSQQEAEAKLFDVDRADILNHLIARQAEGRRLRQTVNSVLALVSDYAEYLKAPDKEGFLKRPFGAFLHSGLKEHLSAADPLASIVEHYRSQLKESDKEYGFFG